MAGLIFTSFLVSRHQNLLDTKEIEIDMISVVVSKSAVFFCAASKLTTMGVFYAGVKIDIVCARRK